MRPPTSTASARCPSPTPAPPRRRRRSSAASRLLHSFEYDQAAEAFRAAQTADPAFAMAFWGEALTYSHLLWGEDDADRGPPRARTARRLARRAAGESRHGAGTRLRRGDRGAVRRRSVAGARARVLGRDARVALAYPERSRCASFAALASMFTAYVGDLGAAGAAGRPRRGHRLRAAGVHRQPEPSRRRALPDPRLRRSGVRARAGSTAARRYAQIAPEAEHALHMPSHIFVQLGLWRDTVASNERSWAASQKEVAALKQTNADLSFHALLFQQYASCSSGTIERHVRPRQGAPGAGRRRSAPAAASRATRSMRSRSWPSSMPPTPASGRRRSAATSARCRRRRRRAPRIASVRSPAAPATNGRWRRCGADRPKPCSTRCGRRLAALPANDPSSPGLRQTLLHAELLAYLGGRPPLDLEALLADPVAAVASAGRSTDDAAHRGAARRGAAEGRPAARGGRRLRARAEADPEPQRGAARPGAGAPCGRRRGRGCRGLPHAPRQLARRRSRRAGARRSAQRRRREVTPAARRA